MVALTLSSSTMQTATAVHLAALPANVDLGVYDSNHSFTDVHTITYEHIWFKWNDYSSTQLMSQLREATAKGRIPLLTIEPWDIATIGTRDHLLHDIAVGGYDRITAAIAKEIDSLNYPVFIRWGHEMECVPTYPWSEKPAEDYIDAFREFVILFKKISPTSQIIWSPVGNKGCEKYYPGDDVVDYAGLTVFELSAASIGWFGHAMSFADWMNDKYPRVAQFNKPIIIAEIGIADTPKNQAAWMQAAFASVQNFPLVRALIYFNKKDTASWKKWEQNRKGPDYPNWTIKPKVFTVVIPDWSINTIAFQ